MIDFRIQNTIHSSAKIWGVDIGGYRFEVDNSRSKFELYAEKTIKAANLEDAIREFNKGIAPLLDALSLTRLSAMSMYGTSTVAIRDDIKQAWVKTMKPRPGTGMSIYSVLSDAENEDVARLISSSDPALNYFRLAMLAGNVIGSTMHFIQALESLAGKHELPSECKVCKTKPVICKNCDTEQLRPPNTNHSKLKQFMGDDLYKYFYVPHEMGENTVRNKLIHGETIIDGFALAERYSQVEKAIIAGLVEKYELSTLPDIDGIRTLQTYESFKEFLEFNNSLPPLPTVVHIMHEHMVINGSDPGLADTTLFAAFKGSSD